ncbi:nickel ABC transporter, membrane protein NikQ [Geotalea daltonii FRC-32]|uniref:Nickel ABC transporter, membrane protein NikQ n=1 Tax=Geotalea daltonii (strain DSM 22248 / JCM 15807 / FRC-32) TaxID=316067 RepID=B9M4Z7_GEODF|nr:cobalt ECF transporter T component CbiQ [Geotalea daltonii]ACM21681.1 nickel ABC transporter, membrane protein NikQ [Geotalea daltonii FRC-32]
MLSIDSALLDFKRLDLLAKGDTAIHRLDPRAKVLVTLAFVVTVVSFGKYELSAVFPFFIFPAVIIALADLPVGYIARKVAIICPFAVIVALFNPLFDRGTMMEFGPLTISGGWISFASVLIRSALTISAALILLCVTGFPSICRAMEKLGMPRAFAVQLLFLYRYIFVLAEEGSRVSRARELRANGKNGLGMKSFIPLLGHLLLRTWLRAERVHMAMLARGFEGNFNTRHQFTFGRRETAFLLCWSTSFFILRCENLSLLVGSLVTELFT